MEAALQDGDGETGAAATEAKWGDGKTTGATGATGDAGGGVRTATGRRAGSVRTRAHRARPKIK